MHLGKSIVLLQLSELSLDLASMDEISRIFF